MQSSRYLRSRCRIATAALIRGWTFVIDQAQSFWRRSTSRKGDDPVPRLIASHSAPHNPLKYFLSVAEAATRPPAQSVSRVCRGATRSSPGFWTLSYNRDTLPPMWRESKWRLLPYPTHVGMRPSMQVIRKDEGTNSLTLVEHLLFLPVSPSLWVSLILNLAKAGYKFMHRCWLPC